MPRIARHRQRAAENDDALLLEEVLAGIDVEDEQPADPASGRTIWTIVLADDRVLGITIHRATGKWVPVPLSDPRAQAVIDHFLREEEVEP